MKSQEGGRGLGWELGKKIISAQGGSLSQNFLDF
jgi:hypothetical protein